MLGFWLFLAVFFGTVAVGFLIAAYRLYQQEEAERFVAQAEIEALQNAKPNITVAPIVNGNRAILRVTNSGGGAVLTASGKVTKGEPNQRWYVMYWEGVAGYERHVDAGSTVDILVGAVWHRTRESEDLYAGGLVLYQIGTQGEQVLGVWIDLIRPDQSGKAIQRREAQCEIEVAITGHPPLVQPFSERYQLAVVNGEMWFNLASQWSIEHTADSPSLVIS